jgi:DNA-binding CsgD family transcriptional regulator
VIRVLVLAETLDSARQLAELLADDNAIEVIGAAGADCGEPVSEAGLEPDVALVAGRALIGDLPFEGVPVVLLDDEFSRAGGWWGEVHACLPASANPREIGAALIGASQGFTLLAQDQTDLALGNAANAARSPRADDGVDRNPRFYETLTPRETQVIRMMAEGLGNKEIAEQLGISDHTAKFHVASILGKLQAQTRAGAVAMGIRRGLIPI